MELASAAGDDNRARLLEKGKTLYKRYCEKDDMACVTGFVAHELDEGRGDAVHDLLAFLAGEMIAMNREQQQVVEDFWLDLEGAAADAEQFNTLRNRGKWEQTLYNNVPAARPYVDGGSRSTARLDASLGWNEEAFKGFVRELTAAPNLSDLVRAYRRHHDGYRALAGRIAATDRLIDQVVYRLYGLTEEEVAIVEGAAAGGA